MTLMAGINLGNLVNTDINEYLVNGIDFETLLEQHLVRLLE
jgi:hypothetical protein